jgi:hypothetical protein
MSSIGERLKRALNLRDRSVRAFQKAMEERHAMGSSAPAIYRYLRGEATPTLQFIEAAASWLEVRREWLAFGEGEITEDLEARARFQKFIELPELTDLDVQDALEGVPEERRDAIAGRYRTAMARFSKKLQDAALSGDVWMELEGRKALLQAAVAYLVGEEELFRRVSSLSPWAEDEAEHLRGRDDLFLRSSSSPGWRVMREDRVLAMFADRVRGLGERTDEFWDAHSPVLDPRREDYEL